MTPEEIARAAEIAAEDQHRAHNYDVMREALKQWAEVMGDFSIYLRDAGLEERLTNELVCQWNEIMADRVIGD